MEVISGKGIEFSDSARGTNAVLWGTQGGDYSQLMYDQSGVQQVQLHTDGDSFFTGGDVGIGMTNPTLKLEVSESQDNDFVGAFRNAHAGGWGLQIQAGDGDGEYTFHCKDYDDQNPLFWVKGDGKAYHLSNVGIGDTSPPTTLTVNKAGTDGFTSATDALRFLGNNGASGYRQCIGWIDNNTRSNATVQIGYVGESSSGPGYGHFFIATHSSTSDAAPTEHFRVGATGQVGIGTTGPNAKLHVEDAYGNAPLVKLHLTGGGGKIIAFFTNSTENGDITEAGGTVSLNGFQGAHQTNISGSTDTNIKEGTVISTTDILYKQNHPQCKISDTENDTRVYGVLSRYVSGSSDFVVASVGVGAVRITGSCAGGDLLVSAGDGCAKVNNSGTLQTVIGKVTANTSGSATEDRLIPCVLYCG